MKIIDRAIEQRADSGKNRCTPANRCFIFRCHGFIVIQNIRYSRVCENGIRSLRRLVALSRKWKKDERLAHHANRRIAENLVNRRALRKHKGLGHVGFPIPTHYFNGRVNGSGVCIIGAFSHLTGTIEFRKPDSKNLDDHRKRNHHSERTQPREFSPLVRMCRKCQRSERKDMA